MATTDDAIRKAQASVDGAISEVMRQSALIIEGQIVLRSPVDTGRFRANWVASTDEPSTERIGSDAEQRRLTRSKERQSGGGEITRPAAVTGASRWRVTRKTARLWLSNNLPYAIALAAGHSDQAPPGWIEAAVRAALRRLGGRRDV